MDPFIIKKLMDNPEYYNYLKESFDWINEATTQIESADKEIGQNFTDTMEQ